jgi:hypothetical protein
VIAPRGQKDLGFVFKTPKGFRVDYPVAVVLKASAKLARLLVHAAALAVGSKTGTRVQDFSLVFLYVLPDGHLVIGKFL